MEISPDENEKAITIQTEQGLIYSIDPIRGDNHKNNNKPTYIFSLYSIIMRQIKNHSRIEFAHSGVKEKLISLYNEGANILILTECINTETSISGSNNGIIPIVDGSGNIFGAGKEVIILIHELRLLRIELGFDIDFIISTSDDKYRKPLPSSWWFYRINKEYPLSQPLLIVGESAGRVHDNGCADRAYAHNLGAKFAVPEEFFENNFRPNELFTWAEYPDMRLELAEIKSKTDKVDYNSFFVNAIKSQEIIIMVGSPCCGKSTFVARFMNAAIENNTQFKYMRVNQDALKTKKKCIDTCQKYLSEGLSVIIDNTNPSASVRAEYISIAKTNNISVRCIEIKASDNIINSMNNYRITTNLSGKKIPFIAFSQYKNKYNEPSVNEGFQELTVVWFYPEFKDSMHEKLFCSRW